MRQKKLGNYYKKLVALVLALILVVTIIPSIVTKPVKADPTQVNVEYDFSNSTAGLAYGNITVTSDEAGLYYFYWGDSAGNKLTTDGIPYSELGWCEATQDSVTNDYKGTYKVISSYTAIPQGATTLLTYYKNETKVKTTEIPLSKQFNGGKSTYKFGLLSDVHYNRYNDYSADDSVPAFNNALKFLNTHNISFIGMTGDLSRASEKSAYTKFKSATSLYPKMTVYTCMGNHDDYNITDFKKYVNSGIKTDKNIKTVSTNGVDFVYQYGGDIFIFFSQTTWLYNTKTSRLVTDDQLNWLEKNLNTYANKNVYLFFHSFFTSPDGNSTTAVGNLINPGGYTYDLPYTFGNTDEKRFRLLLNKYNNVTMFNGHSHWAYSQQVYNPNLNVGNISTNSKGASIVHISSVGDPRVIGINDTNRTELNGQASEGSVAYKYNNGTMYIGTDLKNGKYLAYATYYVSNGKKTTPIPTIKVSKPKITSVGKVKRLSKKSKKYKTKIKYKKISGAVGYEIKYSTSKKFKKTVTKSKKVKKTYYTISKLKNKKTYYIKVRAYKKQFGYNVYGQYSKVKKLKIRKK